MVTMAKMNAERKTSYEILAWFKSIPILSDLLAKGLNSITAGLFHALSSWLSESLHMDFNRVLELLVKNGTESWITNVLTHPVWHDLVDMVDNVITKEPK